MQLQLRAGAVRLLRTRLEGEFSRDLRDRKEKSEACYQLGIPFLLVSDRTVHALRLRCEAVDGWTGGPYGVLLHNPLACTIPYNALVASQQGILIEPLIAYRTSSLMRV